MNDVANDELRQLLLATARGEARAFKSLYDETSARLHAVALTLMRDPALAEDVLQDAFVQIWHRADEYHADRGSVFTWMTTIVRYRAIDLLRRRRQDRPIDRRPSIEVDPTEIDYLQAQQSGDASPDGSAGPLASAIASEENSMLRECVERLSNNQQLGVALAFFRGMTHQELSDCLTEPLGTVKSRLRRSLSRLKECLENLRERDEIQRNPG